MSSRWREVLALGAAAVLAAAIPGVASAFSWPWGRHGPWPDSSSGSVEVLNHPTVESAFERRAREGNSGTPYRFAAFGDQRALADGEWQEILLRIVAWEEANGPVSFLLDTGDIVQNGEHADQFEWLAKHVLAIAPDKPYLVGVGNHELKNNREPAARDHTARFLSYLDEDLGPERLWYRKDLGPATFLFLDTNDLVYGVDGERKRCPTEPLPESREKLQLVWLLEQLEETGLSDALVVAVLHHPPVQSSKMHRGAAASLWNMHYEGKRLVDHLADGGVDVVLTGHTHTYERFLLERDDGSRVQVVNLSGRPRDAFLWFGSGRRRAKDLSGRENEYFTEHGWHDLERWTIRQEDRMQESEEANQFAIFTVDPDGGLSMELHFLDESAPGGTRAAEAVRLR